MRIFLLQLCAVFGRARKIWKTKKLLLASSCPSVRTSVRVEELVSQRTDFHKIWLIIFEYLPRKLKDN
jgi:hypothetical protein